MNILRMGLRFRFVILRGVKCFLFVGIFGGEEVLGKRAVECLW
jgi:hypothetical protein